MNWLTQRINYEAKCARKIEKYISLYRRGGVYKYLAYWKYIRFRNHNNCLFSYKTTVGKNLYLAHPDGVVIGGTAIIGNNVSVYPSVKVVANLAGLRKNLNDEKTQATIGDNCVLCANCTIVGNITIGKNCIIAAGAVVTKDIPDNSLVINTNEIRENKHDNLLLQKDVIICNHYKTLFYDEKLLNG